MLTDNPLLVYNSDCAFCRDIANFLLKHYGEKEGLKIIPNTSPIACGLHKDLNCGNIQKNVHFIHQGNLHSAGEGVIYVLALKKKLRFLIYIYKCPGLKQLIDLSYLILKKLKRYYSHD